MHQDWKQRQILDFYFMIDGISLPGAANHSSSTEFILAFNPDGDFHKNCYRLCSLNLLSRASTKKREIKQHETTCQCLFVRLSVTVRPFVWLRVYYLTDI